LSAGWLGAGRLDGKTNWLRLAGFANALASYSSADWVNSFTLTGLNGALNLVRSSRLSSD
jgi:hypothetical protein